MPPKSSKLATLTEPLTQSQLRLYAQFALTQASRDMEQLEHVWHRYDAAVSSTVFSTLYRLGYDQAKHPASPSTRGLPFIDSPTLQVTFVLGYLLIVLLGYLKHTLVPGKQKADSLWLKTLVQIHNVNLIVLSSYMSYTAASLAWKYSYRFWGQGYRSSERDMGHIIYVFYVSKLYEFVDTVRAATQVVLPKSLLCGMLITKFHELSFHAVHHAAKGKARAGVCTARLPSRFNLDHLVCASGFVAAVCTYPRHCRTVCCYL